METRFLIRLSLLGLALALTGAACLAGAGPAAAPAPASADAKPAAAAAAGAARPGGPPALPPSPAIDAVMKDPGHKVGFIRKTLKRADGTQRIYQVWVPLDYSADKKWPTILFLHGRGECGNDGEKVLIQGLPKEIRKRDGKFEFIVVAPQCEELATPIAPPPTAPGKEPGKDAPRPRTTLGWTGPNEEDAMKALRTTMTEYSCDPEHLYLTGLSMGGHGTWALAMKYPKEFVAIVPICGFGDPSRAAEIAHLPTWVWHGGADKTVPVDGSRKMVEALKAAGAKEVKYTELPGVGHNSWDNAYADDALWTWFLAHRRPGKS